MWNNFKTFFKFNIREISDNESLSWVGFLLSAGHIFTFLFIMPQAVDHLSNDVNIQCWQYFPNCEVLRIHSRIFWEGYFFLYLAAALSSMVLFFQKKILNGYFFLLAISLMKLIFFVLDRRFIGNYHFMHLVYTSLFLFFPKKEFYLKILTAWFYVAAGTLKLNPEWLSGAAVGRPISFLSPFLQHLSYIYVIVLEFCVVWGLFSKNKLIKWLSLAQFIIFHLVSVYWVGFFYPCIMLSLLSVFPLSWANPSLANDKLLVRLKSPAILVIILLSLGQFISLIGPDPAIHTERRLFSMNMYDARSVCTINFFIHTKSQEVAYSPDLDTSGVRVHCDKSVVLNMIKNLCRDLEKDPNAISLDVHMLSRRSTGKSYEDIFSRQDVCPRIKTMSYYDWLEAEL